MGRYRDCPKCGGWGIRPPDETHCIHCMGKGKLHTKESLLQLLADEKGVPMHDLGKLEPSERAEVLAEMTRRAQAPRSAKKQAELEEELRAYEVKYGMTTEEVAHAWSRNEDGDLSVCGYQVLEEFYIPARTPSDGWLHDHLCKRCLARLEAMRELGDP